VPAAAHSVAVSVHHLAAAGDATDTERYLACALTTPPPTTTTTTTNGRQGRATVNKFNDIMQIRNGEINRGEGSY